MSWTELKSSIASRELASDTWESDKRSLLHIFDQAERHGIDPYFAAIAPLSNLRSAVSECKRAIRWENWNFLAEVLRKCATLTNVELRLALHIPELQNVSVEQEGDLVKVALTPGQFANVQRKTRLQLKFTKVEHKPAPAEYYEYQ